MPASVQLIRSTGLWSGTAYAHAASVSSEARLVFLAGACPLDSEGRVLSAGDYRGQAEACLDTMRAALLAAGANLDDVISTRVLVASTDRSDLVVAWDAVQEAFGDHDVPSTLFGVTVLGYEGQLVEIEAVAAVVD